MCICMCVHVCVHISHLGDCLAQSNQYIKGLPLLSVVVAVVVVFVVSKFYSDTQGWIYSYLSCLGVGELLQSRNSCFTNSEKFSATLSILSETPVWY